jgi:hypothetical protein
MMAAQATAPAASTEKLFKTQQARAACAGILLHQLDGDFGSPIFIATRLALTRQFDTLHEVRAWLDRVTGKASVNYPGTC